MDDALTSPRDGLAREVPPPRRAGRIVSIHSFRGGTGKSNSTANLAVLLAREGLRVAVIDTDIQSPGIHVLFGCDPAGFKWALNDYLWGRCDIRDAAVEVTEVARGGVASRGAGAGDLAEAEPEGRLYLVPSSLDAGDIARVLRDGYDAGLLGEGLRELVRALELDYLLIDTHPGVNEETLLSIAISDLFLLLLRPDAQDFQGTSVTLELARRLGVEEIRVIINKVPPGIDGAGLRARVESAYESPVIGILPLSNDMARLASSGIFVVRFPDHPWSLELQSVAREVRGGERP
jgi:MinD-like ATPase involved in chromosome partitioning or flagellar assembly